MVDAVKFGKVSKIVVIKECDDIAMALEYRDNLERIGDISKEDDVVPVNDTAHLCSKL